MRLCKRSKREIDGYNYESRQVLQDKIDEVNDLIKKVDVALKVMKQSKTENTCCTTCSVPKEIKKDKKVCMPSKGEVCPMKNKGTSGKCYEINEISCVTLKKDTFNTLINNEDEDEEIQILHETNQMYPASEEMEGSQIDDKEQLQNTRDTSCTDSCIQMPVIQEETVFVKIQKEPEEIVNKSQICIANNRICPSARRSQVKISESPKGDGQINQRIDKIRKGLEDETEFKQKQNSEDYLILETNELLKDNSIEEEKNAEKEVEFYSFNYSQEMKNKEQSSNLIVQKMPSINIRSELVLQPTLHLNIDSFGISKNELNNKPNVLYNEFKMKSESNIDLSDKKSKCKCKSKEEVVKDNQEIDIDYQEIVLEVRNYENTIKRDEPNNKEDEEEKLIAIEDMEEMVEVEETEDVDITEITDDLEIELNKVLEESQNDYIVEYTESKKSVSFSKNDEPIDDKEIVKNKKTKCECKKILSVKACKDNNLLGSKSSLTKNEEIKETVLKVKEIEGEQIVNDKKCQCKKLALAVVENQELNDEEIAKERKNKCECRKVESVKSPKVNDMSCLKNDLKHITEMKKLVEGEPKIQEGKRKCQCRKVLSAKSSKDNTLIEVNFPKKDENEESKQFKNKPIATDKRTKCECKKDAEKKKNEEISKEKNKISECRKAKSLTTSKVKDMSFTKNGDESEQVIEIKNLEEDEPKVEVEKRKYECRKIMSSKISKDMNFEKSEDKSEQVIEVIDLEKEQMPNKYKEKRCECWKTESPKIFKVDSELGNNTVIKRNENKKEQKDKTRKCQCHKMNLGKSSKDNNELSTKNEDETDSKELKDEETAKANKTKYECDKVSSGKTSKNEVSENLAKNEEMEDIKENETDDLEAKDKTDESYLESEYSAQFDEDDTRDDITENDSESEIIQSEYVGRRQHPKSNESSTTGEDKRWSIFSENLVRRVTLDFMSLQTGYCDDNKEDTFKSYQIMQKNPNGTFMKRKDENTPKFLSDLKDKKDNDDDNLTEEEIKMLSADLVEISKNKGNVSIENILRVLHSYKPSRADLNEILELLSKNNELAGMSVYITESTQCSAKDFHIDNAQTDKRTNINRKASIRDSDQRNLPKKDLDGMNSTKPEVELDGSSKVTLENDNDDYMSVMETMKSDMSIISVKSLEEIRQNVPVKYLTLVASNDDLQASDEDLLEAKILTPHVKRRDTVACFIQPLTGSSRENINTLQKSFVNVSDEISTTEDGISIQSNLSKKRPSIGSSLREKDSYYSGDKRISGTKQAMHSLAKFQSVERHLDKEFKNEKKNIPKDALSLDEKSLSDDGIMDNGINKELSQVRNLKNPKGDVKKDTITGGKCRKMKGRQMCCKETSMDPTLASIDADTNMSEGEIKCKCTVSVGEIHTCNTGIYDPNNKRLMDRMIRRHFKDNKLRVARQRTFYSNWVAYYVEQDYDSINDSSVSNN